MGTDTDPIVADIFCNDLLMPIESEDSSPVRNQSDGSLDDLADKFNPNEFFSQSTFINTKTGKEQTEYAGSVAGSMSSGTGSLSPSSQRGSPQSTPIHSNGRITISIQPNEKTTRRISTREKLVTKAKKARLDIKTELIDTVVDDEQHEEISYVETTDLDKQMCVTAEEREVLEREGWELTEKNLKKARRKIKNKISAQESRKRKRDYVNNLEERLADFTSENSRLKQDLEKERNEKKSLVSQLRELQKVVGSQFQVKNTKTSGTQTSAAVMVVLLCCTVFKGSFFSKEPAKETRDPSIMDDNLDFDYTTPSYKSRVLKCFTDDDIDFCSDDGVDVPVMNFDLSDSETEYTTDDPGDDLFALDKGFSALTLESNARLRQNITEIGGETRQTEMVIHTS